MQEKIIINVTIITENTEFDYINIRMNSNKIAKKYSRQNAGCFEGGVKKSVEQK